ncbi:LmeA family phospholipid-binding protein [Phycicoccus sp. BSK3Z-2]|uniref:LmeA family phospholipid-binding protein n=1 Tax=Phycicoccus avicenniae TaxID=2828860 RepID=A0A941D8I1_9MICO|nr:LmeA family phospholipid-binding protein [Phycicoccus avicenniae]MBR7743043.1 LmeA family phospholipid-binding protein [Phycicoccus avicenniae]
MKNFLLGVVTTLAVLAVGGAVLLASLGSGAEPLDLPPSAAPATPAQAPDDLGPQETWLGSVDLSSQGVVAPDGSLADVTAQGTGVRFGPDGLRAQRLDIDATVPFDVVAEQIGDGVRLYAANEGRTGIERTASVLGRDVTIRATADVSAQDGRLLIEPATVDVGGPSFLDAAISAVARTLVTFRQDVPGVPEGMALREVTTGAAGFAVTLQGRDVVVN